MHAVDDDAGAAAALEVGRHHVAEHARAHVAARIDHDHVAFLDMVEHMAVQLRFGIGIFALAEQVGPLRQELQRQRRADDRLAGVLRHRAQHVRAAEAHMAERAGDRRRPDVLERPR
jgi:hypothetical protein